MVKLSVAAAPRVLFLPGTSLIFIALQLLQKPTLFLKQYSDKNSSNTHYKIRILLLWGREGKMSK